MAEWPVTTNEARRRLHVAVKSGNISNVRGVLSVCDQNTASRAIWQSGTRSRSRAVRSLQKPVIFTAVEQSCDNILALLCTPHRMTTFRPWTCTYAGMSVVGYTIATGRSRLLQTLLTNQTLPGDWGHTDYTETTAFMPNVFCSPLFVAIQSRDYHAVKCLIHANASPVAPLWQPNGTSPLLYSIRIQDCRMTMCMTTAIIDNTTMSPAAKALVFAQGKDTFTPEGFAVASNDSLSLFISSEDTQHMSRPYKHGRKRLVIAPEESPTTHNLVHLVTRQCASFPNEQNRKECRIWSAWMDTALGMFGVSSSPNILHLVNDALGKHETNLQILQVCRWVEAVMSYSASPYSLEQIVKHCASEAVPVQLPQQLIVTVTEVTEHGRCNTPLPFTLISEFHNLMCRALDTSGLEDITVLEKSFYDLVLQRIEYTRHTLTKMKIFGKKLRLLIRDLQNDGHAIDDDRTLISVLMKMVLKAHRLATGRAG